MSAPEHERETGDDVTAAAPAPLPSPASPFEVPGLGALSRMIGLGELAALGGRAASLVSSLPANEAVDARRVLALVQEIALAPAPAAAAGAEDDPAVTRRIELRGLAERLGRRSAEGIPFASLARAASAELHGSLSDAFRIRAECDGQLLMFGL